MTELNIELKKFPFLERNNVHLFVSPEELKQLEDAFVVSPIGTVIAKSSPECVFSVNTYSKLLRSYLQKEDLFFGMFFSDQSNIHNFEITSEAEMQSILADSVKILSKLGFRARVLNTVISALEELLLNAFYNAPIDSRGKSVFFSNLKSALQSPFLNFRPVLVQIGVDSEMIGIKVTDRYGSLNRTKLFLKLSKLFSSAPFRVEQSSAGAGLGLSLIFVQGGSLFVVVTPGVKTEVHVFFKASKHIKELRTEFRFLATYFYPNKTKIQDG